MESMGGHSEERAAALAGFEPTPQGSRASTANVSRSQSALTDLSRPLHHWQREECPN